MKMEEKQIEIKSYAPEEVVYEKLFIHVPTGKKIRAVVLKDARVCINARDFERGGMYGFQCVNEQHAISFVKHDISWRPENICTELHYEQTKFSLKVEKDLNKLIKQAEECPF